MIRALLGKSQELRFERTYAHPAPAVWRAWTDAEALRRWWGPDKTTIPECEVDARVGGRIYVVMEADEGMGKYAGTRWPMEGTFTRVDADERLTYDARSWTEGGESTSTISHVNDLTLAPLDGGGTRIELKVSITEIGSKAKMAAFGMKWGYKHQLEELERHLAEPG